MVLLGAFVLGVSVKTDELGWLVPIFLARLGSTLLVVVTARRGRPLALPRPPAADHRRDRAARLPRHGGIHLVQPRHRACRDGSCRGRVRALRSDPGRRRRGVPARAPDTRAVGGRRARDRRAWSCSGSRSGSAAYARGPRLVGVVDRQRGRPSPRRSRRRGRPRRAHRSLHELLSSTAIPITFPSVGLSHGLVSVPTGAPSLRHCRAVLRNVASLEHECDEPARRVFAVSAQRLPSRGSRRRRGGSACRATCRTGSSRAGSSRSR